MTDFWAMGGYAFYVWTSYGIAFLVLLSGILKPFFAHKKILRDLQHKRQRGR